MKNFLVAEISDMCFKIIYYKNKKQPIEQISISNYDAPITEQTFLDNIQSFIHNNNINTKNIALIIKENESIKRFITVPNMTLSNLESMIHNNLPDFFPIDTDDYLVDYKILFKDKDNIDIMLIAIKNSIIYYYLSIFQKLDLNCFCIDTFYNCISDYFSKYNDKVLIGYMCNNKYIFSYLENSVIKNIRDFEFLDERDVFQQINRSFGFYSLELLQVKKVFLLDEYPIVYDAFNKYKINVYKKNNFLDDNIELVGILGLIKRI